MTDPDEEIDALVGASVGKYRIDDRIGRGGMGAVYRATNTQIGKRVALKFLDREATRDSDAVTRFQREAEAASAVESAHIVQIFDSGRSEDGRPYLVMELLSGEDLRARMRREGRLDLPVVVHVAGQVLRALHRAHQAGIVHRDLKPDNVFLCRRDDDPMFVKIVDFGISKVSRSDATLDTLTRRGTVLGTAFYMSPEQAQAYPDIDGRTDLFSLGAIMFEALTGRPPHIGTAYEAVLIDICTKDAPDVRTLAPDVPEAVALVIAKALARDRDVRFTSAREFLEALALAAPGLVRTGGPGGRDLLTSTPESVASSKPTVSIEAHTAGGTAVHPHADGRGHARRTVVVAIVAALGAFSVTALLMARGPHADAGAAAGPATNSARPATSDDLVAPSATATADAGPATADAATDARAATPPGIATHKRVPHVTRPPPPATSHSSGPAKPPSTGVASGLKLNTSGP